MGSELEKVIVHKYTTTDRYVSPAELRNRIHFLASKREINYKEERSEYPKQYFIESGFKKVFCETVLGKCEIITWSKSDPIHDFKKLLPYLEEIDKQLSLYYEESRITFKNTED